ncbi:MAG: DNA methyltransferase [Nitrospirae bacterium]|nr:DNA methyltransferase [Nitrospirota bacterium]
MNTELDNRSMISVGKHSADYDKRTFCISQAFFPDSSAWYKLKRALEASIDEELLASTRSMPFKLVKEKQISVKVIDHRRNEVMAVRKVG